MYSMGGGFGGGASGSHYGSQGYPPGSIYGYGTTPPNANGYFNSVAPGGGGSYGQSFPAASQWKSYFSDNQHAWTSSAFINFVLNMPWFVILFLVTFISFIIVWHINPSCVQQPRNTQAISKGPSDSTETQASPPSASDHKDRNTVGCRQKHPPSILRVAICSLVIASAFLTICYLLLRVLIATNKLRPPTMNGISNGPMIPQTSQ